VPEPVQPEDHQPPRSDAERAADHAAIDRLADELLPALIAKLGATGLGELEVHEGAWRVRLRRPGDPTGSSPGTPARERRPGERERAARAGAGAAGAHLPASLTAVGPGRDGRESRGREPRDGSNGREREIREVREVRDGGRIVAGSPAVGIFQPRNEARAGTKVRAGDRLGSVDMLGIAQEVVAPADGVVGASLVEPGDAVEYGQDLIVIEFATSSASATPEA
jgi:biotin carboxyl carrier protein